MRRVGAIVVPLAVVALLVGATGRVDGQNLRHHWPLDETSGLLAADYVLGADGTLRNFFLDDDSQWVEGEFNGGLWLGVDGDLDNYVEMTLPAMDATVTGGFTIMMWVNPGFQIDTPAEYQLLSTTGDSIGVTIMNWENEGELFDRVLLFWDGSTANLTTGSTTLEPGGWYHVAVTSEGAGGEKRLYVNGVEEVERFYVPSLGGADVATRNGWPAGAARLGSAIGGGRHHDSQIDDVRIYEGVLSEDEILDVIENPPNEPPRITLVSPLDGEMFHDAEDGIEVDIETENPGATIPEDGIVVFLNGEDVSEEITLAGGEASREVEIGGLEAGKTYVAVVEVTDSAGEFARSRFVFGTYEFVDVFGLLHRLPLDETSGLYAADVAGGGYGQLLGFENDDDSQWIEGQEAGALDTAVDASINNYVDAPVSTVSAFLTGGYTLAFWVRPGEMIRNVGEYQLLSTPGDAVGVTIMNTTNQGEEFDRNILFWDGSAPNIVTSTTSLEPGTWYHVAVTSTGTGGVREIYVNGAVEAKRLFNPTSGGEDLGTADGWNEGRITIGSFWSGGRYHDAAFDDVRVYEYALDEDEIGELVGEAPALPPEITSTVPADGNAFHSAGTPLRVEVSTPNPGATIEAAGVQMTLNGEDVSGDVTLSGDGASRVIEYSGLDPELVYEAEIEITDSAGGTARLLLAFATVTPSTEPGLRHHLRLDETRGLVAADRASGVLARLAGFELDDDAQWVAGQVDGALDLGADDTVDNRMTLEMPAMSALETGGFTIAMWIRPGDEILSQTPGEYQLFSSPAGGGIGFTIMNRNQLGTLFDRNLLIWDGSADRIVLGSTVLEPGTWYHVAVTHTGVDGVREFYVNGVQETKQIWTLVGQDIGNSDGWGAGTALIGGLAGDRHHSSVIDDFRVYEVALSAEEVADLASLEPPETVFHRGDADASGALNITDGIYVLNFLFLGGPDPVCLDAADADDSGALNITDGIFVLNFLFLGGTEPPAPGPTENPCGPDPTDDELDCALYEGC